MKKTLNTLLALLIIVLLTVPANADEGNLDETFENGYYPETSQIYLESSKAMQEMMDLQNSITSSLSVENGKYNYDVNYIRDIVYKFDFTDINKELGETYSNEKFLELVLESLESTVVNEPEEVSVRAFQKGSMCGVNKNDSIWNAKREYRSYWRTIDHIKYLNSEANNVSMNSRALTDGGADQIIATIAVFSKITALGLKGAKLTYSAYGLYMRSVANSLKKANKPRSSNDVDTCGTVLDINIFTRHFWSFNQVDNNYYTK